jgi:hypothetical protein
VIVSASAEIHMAEGDGAPAYPIDLTFQRNGATLDGASRLGRLFSGIVRERVRRAGSSEITVVLGRPESWYAEADDAGQHLTLKLLHLTHGVGEAQDIDQVTLWDLITDTQKDLLSERAIAQAVAR